MHLKYLVLLITLKNINCYNPKRHTQSSNNFNNLKSKTSSPVVPARYKITSKANYEDPTTGQSFPSEFFPEVEYPESIVDSSKPFYLSASPFPSEVKSTFNSLVAQRNSKAKSITDHSWIHNEKSKEKISPPEQKVGVNEVTDSKGIEINSDDKSTNETLVEDIAILDIDDDVANYRIPYSDNDMLFINWTSSEQSSECPELDYVVGFIDDLDKFMKNLTDLETTVFDEGINSTLHTLESERPDEIQSVKLAVPPNYNESTTALNGHSFLTGEQPERIRDSLFRGANDALTNYTPLLNENIRNTTSVEDKESDFCSVETIANETITSCNQS